MPIALEGWIARNDNEFLYRELLMLPLGADDTVDHILSIGVAAPRSSEEFRRAE